jgi:hypothetical protein
MPRRRPLDDETAEAVVAGQARDEDLAGLSAFVEDARAAGAGPPPHPQGAFATRLADGFSTEKGDRSATTASNAHGSAPQTAGLPKWRKAKMKVSGFVAGLPVAAKIALSVTVAAAAVGGAGAAAGVLPGGPDHPVIEAGGGGGEEHPVIAPDEPTTTTAPGGGEKPTTTTLPKPDGDKPPITTTPPPHEEPKPPTTTTPPATEPHHEEPPPTTPPTSPPGDTFVPELGTLQCHGEGPEGQRRVDCTWSAGPDGTKKYVVIRVTGDSTQGQVVYQSENLGVLGVSDVAVIHGTSYKYMVLWLGADGKALAHSNKVTVVP